MSAGSPKNTRSRKASLKDTPKAEAAVDFSSLLRECENRLKAFFKDEINSIKTDIRSITDHLSSIDANISNLKTETVRLDEEIAKIKDVVKMQQLRIEKYEVNLRANNLIVHNIPENEVDGCKETLISEREKIAFLSEAVGVNLSLNDIALTQRLGKRSTNRPRPLKVCFKSKEQKYRLLNKRRDVSRNATLKQVFGATVYLNPDNTVLVQQEERRLRSRLQSLKIDDPDGIHYIRSGVLYSNGKEVDRVNMIPQLF